MAHTLPLCLAVLLLHGSVWAAGSHTPAAHTQHARAVSRHRWGADLHPHWADKAGGQLQSLYFPVCRLLWVRVPAVMMAHFKIMRNTEKENCKATWSESDQGYMRVRLDEGLVRYRVSQSVGERLEVNRKYILDCFFLLCHFSNNTLHDWWIYILIIIIIIIVIMQNSRNGFQKDREDHEERKEKYRAVSRRMNGAVEERGITLRRRMIGRTRDMSQKEFGLLFKFTCVAQKNLLHLFILQAKERLKKCVWDPPDFQTKQTTCPTLSPSHEESGEPRCTILPIFGVSWFLGNFRFPQKDLVRLLYDSVMISAIFTLTRSTPVPITVKSK